MYLSWSRRIRRDISALQFFFYFRIKDYAIAENKRDNAWQLLALTYQNWIAEIIYIYIYFSESKIELTPTEAQYREEEEEEDDEEGENESIEMTTTDRDVIFLPFYSLIPY